MAAGFDNLLQASFADFPFPVSRIVVRGGLRDHVHEYPHSPGGAPEKLGRKLYEIEFTCPFVNTLIAYPKLWPETLASLRIFFENGATRDLVIPTIGTIQAYCIDWPEEADPKVNRSGVTVTLKFREDQSGAFLVEELIFVSIDDLRAVAAQFLHAYEREGLTVGIFTQIRQAAARLTAVLDQAELAGDLITAQTEGLSSLCQQADERLDVLNNPAHVRVLQALHRLWRASNKLHADALRLGNPIQTFVLPLAGTLTDAARFIYGDTARTVQLLKLNPIVDPFNLPAGTVLRAYAP